MGAGAAVPAAAPGAGRGSRGRTYHEDVVGVRHLPAGPEQLAQVIELRGGRGAQRGQGAPGAEAGAVRRGGAVTWPWMSPHTVTGVQTGCTLDSSSSRSHT